MALKEENLEPYETPSAPKPPAEPEVVEVKASAPLMNLRVGVNVAFKDLVGRNDLNGKHGLVIEYLEEKARWKVEVDETAEVIAVKRANLTICGSKRVYEEQRAPPPPPEDIPKILEKSKEQLLREWTIEQARMAKQRADEIKADEDFEMANTDRQNQTEKQAAKRKRQHDFSKL